MLAASRVCSDNLSVEVGVRPDSGICAACTVVAVEAAGSTAYSCSSYAALRAAIEGGQVRAVKSCREERFIFGVLASL